MVARGDKGYTLVELVVVILIFSIVMTLISVSFHRIAASSAQIGKSAETDVGGLIGLELMRSDLELAGFGLPWTLPNGASYSEAGNTLLVRGCGTGCAGAIPSRFNDAPAAAPRAYLVGDKVGINGSDYLVLKGTALGMSAVSRSWSYLNYSSTGPIVKPSTSEVELKPGNGDRVIVMKSGATDAGAATRELVTDGGSSFTLSFDLQNGRLPSGFEPKNRGETYLVYGVAPADSKGLPLAFPFNRADYYLSLPPETGDISTNCAPGTAVLYKATLNHNGSITRYPLLDCALDMQVVFGLDLSINNGYLNKYSPDLSNYHAADLSELQLTEASQLRDVIKEIRVYILAQQGRKDRGYLYPVSDPEKVIVVGDPRDTSLNQTWTQSKLSTTVGADWRNYHWKIYTIVVQPKNL
jgi:prepilin-type N-terminal cleavage/methylation domain-containing protein